MIEMLSKKTSRGDLYLALARQYLAHQEWGLARKAAEDALAKGSLSEPQLAIELFAEISEKLESA